MNLRARSCLSIALLGLTPLAACLPVTAASSAQQAMRLETTIQKQVVVPYLLFLPKDYNAEGARRWPLMIFLHGAGERGTDLERVKVHGPPKIVESKPDFPFVLVSPQCAPGQRWDVDALEALLDEVLEKHAVDPRRVYLTGLSMGGYGTWAWASAHPSRFAAIAPICGGGDPIRVRLAGGRDREELARLPIWAFHGARDTVVPLSASEEMVAAFRGLGNEPRLTVYPEAGHDSWTETYDNPELYQWLLEKSRP